MKNEVEKHDEKAKPALRGHEFGDHGADDRQCGGDFQRAEHERDGKWQADVQHLAQAAGAP
ncbi:MAG TPA: hypothetical protein VGJ20_00580 [Xanthobacteraceae bacterium]